MTLLATNTITLSIDYCFCWNNRFLKIVFRAKRRFSRTADNRKAKERFGFRVTLIKRPPILDGTRVVRAKFCEGTKFDEPWACTWYSNAAVTRELWENNYRTCRGTHENYLGVNYFHVAPYRPAVICGRHRAHHRRTNCLVTGVPTNSGGVFVKLDGGDS